MFPAARALRSDVVRRAASRGGTLRCAKTRRVAYRDVDKSYASHRPKRYGWVARRLQDSDAVVVVIFFESRRKRSDCWTAQAERALNAKLAPVALPFSKECYVTGRADGKDAALSYVIVNAKIVVMTARRADH